ncbi:MAG: Tim44/TimA family putative adaptor protein [Brevirhabdus sp.]
MSSAAIQLLVLAIIAIFLILRLKNVLGTRDGFERPPRPLPREGGEQIETNDFEVIEGGADTEIADYVDVDSDAGKAFAAMKRTEPSFSIGEFLQGAKGAYEMILMAFENGDIKSVEPFLSDDVNEAFVDVIAAREDQGLSVEATFVGMREMTVAGAAFNEATGEAEITVRFISELTSVVRNAEGEIVEGNATEIKRQKDVWTFSRRMGVDDPNWTLVETGG